MQTCALLNCCDPAMLCTNCADHSTHEHWTLSQGTKQIKRLEENVGGFELSQRISKADLDELSSFFHMDAAVGERWAQCVQTA
jgi:hypothetical protein